MVGALILKSGAPSVQGFVRLVQGDRSSEFCMPALCCTKRATAKATAARRIFLLQRATERFAEGCAFFKVEPNHWNGSSLRALESLCRRPHPKARGGWEGQTCTLSRKTIRLIRLQNSMLFLTSKFCMLTLCCTKRATAKATTARRIFLLQRATERFAEGCPFGHWQASAAFNKETKTANKQTKQLCVVCQSSSH